jgi:hypothetical protein
MKIIVNFIIWFGLLIWTTALTGQRASEAGIFLGASNYQGEFSPAPVAFNETRPAIGLVYTQFLDPNWGITGMISYGRITGRDSNLSLDIQRDRNWAFQTGLLEFATSVQYQPWGAPRLNAAGLFFPRFSPYVAAGLGVAFANNTVTVPSEGREIAPEPDAKSVFVTLPVSLGLRFVWSERLTFIGEFGQRAVFSDYLDGVSLRGDPTTNDWFYRFGLGITYTLMAEY